MPKLHEVGRHISVSTQIYKNLLKKEATRCNTLFTFMRAGYFRHILLPTKLSCMLTVAVEMFDWFRTLRA